MNQAGELKEDPGYCGFGLLTNFNLKTMDIEQYLEGEVVPSVNAPAPVLEFIDLPQW